MGEPAAPFLSETARINIRQNPDWLELLIFYDRRDQYELSNFQQQPVGTMIERGWPILGALKRLALGGSRGFRIDLFDPNGERRLTLRRNLHLWFSRTRVEDGSARRIGIVHRRWSWLRYHYELSNAAGEVFAVSRSGHWLSRNWVYEIRSTTDEREAVVRRHYPGILRSALTLADDFRVHFLSKDWDEDERALILASAIAIDFDVYSAPKWQPW